MKNVADFKVVMIGTFQQQAEALSTQFSNVFVLYNESNPPRNILEMLKSTSLNLIPYTAGTFLKEIKSWYLIINRIEPDVIYANGFRQLIILSGVFRIFRFRKQAPLILATSHNFFAWNTTYKRYAIAAICSVFADGIFLLAKYQEVWLKKNVWNKNNIRYIPNAVDVNQFSPLILEKESDSEVLRIVTIADYNPNKGQDVLIRAVQNLVQKNINVEVLLVGKDITQGKYLNDLRQLIRQMGLEQKINLYGPVTHEDIPGIINSADIAILPSWGEVCSYFIQEAMACEKLVVASSVGGNLDLIEDGITGLLFPPGDVLALEGVILIGYNDKSLRKKIALNARKYMFDKFCFSAIGIQHMAFIDYLVRRKRLL